MEQMTPETFKIKLAKRLRQLRKEANMTQSELAFRIGGRDKQFINNYETKGANPTFYTGHLICKALGITYADLVDFSKLEDEA